MNANASENANASASANANANANASANTNANANTNTNANVLKKAVHVKWAGKTIALGTFPIAEADDKCARAKALTRAWRSTMRPKPTREWVMLELERLDVRVVSGRVAQKENSGSDSDSGDDENPVISSRVLFNNNSNTINTTTLSSAQQQQQQLTATGALSSIDHDLLNPDQHRRNSITASLLNVADLARSNDQRSSIQNLDSSFFSNQQGSLSITPKHNFNVNELLAGESTAGDKKEIATDAQIPPHRPFVGGGSAAAYEATREDHYRKVAERRKAQNKDTGAASGVINYATNNLAIGGGSSGGGTVAGLADDAVSFGDLNQNRGGIGTTTMSLSSNANQHYEMLKLHHMNLLNEIQETTLMMNLYQQQHLQQQMQFEQLNKNRFVDPQLSLLSQQQLGNTGGALGQAGESVGSGPFNGQQDSLVENNAAISQRRSSNVNNSNGSNTNSILNSITNDSNSFIGNSIITDITNSKNMGNIGINANISINNITNDSISNGINNNNSMIGNNFNTGINNSNNMANKNIINNGNSINNNSSNITDTYASHPIGSPVGNISARTNCANSNGKRNSNNYEGSNGTAETIVYDDQLQRIKKEIAERQQMVDELERMTPR